MDIQIISQVVPNNLRQMYFQFLNQLNALISWKTPLNYYPKDIIMENNYFIITIPVVRLTAEDNELNDINLINQRVNVIKKFFNDPPISKMAQSEIRLIRYLQSQGIHCRDYKLKTIINESTIKLNIPSFLDTVHCKLSTKNNNRLIQIIDETLDEYGLFINLSRPHEDLGLMLNGIHLYEHLMFTPFEDLNMQKLSSFNGYTYPNGLCFLHFTSNDPETILTYYDAFKDFYKNSSKKGFWNDSDIMKREIRRTISECYDIPIIQSNKNDDRLSSKNFIHDIGRIMEYLSSYPLEVLIVGPTLIQCQPLSYQTESKRPQYLHLPFNVPSLWLFKSIYSRPVKNPRNYIPKLKSGSMSGLLGVNSFSGIINQDNQRFNANIGLHLLMLYQWTAQEITDNYNGLVIQKVEDLINKTIF